MFKQITPLLLLSFVTDGQDQPCQTWYKWKERYDDQNTWVFDRDWREDVVDSDCSEKSKSECCASLDECEWIHQSNSGYWNGTPGGVDQNCNGASDKGHCTARTFPLGYRPFKLSMFNTETPCIEVEASRGGIVEILIETDSPARICVADSANIGNVDRSEGAVLDGQCSDDGRLHACINADTRTEDGNQTVRDLKFYVWCDQNCMEYDTEMWIRTQKSAVKWDKRSEQEGLYSAAYYGYAEGGGRCESTADSPDPTAEQFCADRIRSSDGSTQNDNQGACEPDSQCRYTPLYYDETQAGHNQCKRRCFNDSACQSYSWGNELCKLSNRKLDLFSWQCDLRNQQWPLTTVEDDAWETRDLLDAATGNAEMWCMYEQGLKARDCLPLVRFPSDLNERQPAEFVELFLDQSPAAAWGVPTLLLLPALWIV